MHLRKITILLLVFSKTIYGQQQFTDTIENEIIICWENKKYNELINLIQEYQSINKANCFDLNFILANAYYFTGNKVNALNRFIRYVDSFKQCDSCLSKKLRFGFSQRINSYLKITKLLLDLDSIDKTIIYLNRANAEMDKFVGDGNAKYHIYQTLGAYKGLANYKLGKVDSAFVSIAPFAINYEFGEIELITSTLKLVINSLNFEKLRTEFKKTKINIKYSSIIINNYKYNYYYLLWNGQEIYISGSPGIYSSSFKRNNLYARKKLRTYINNSFLNKELLLL